MSTSRYSKPDIISPSRTDQYPERGMRLQFPPPNTRKWTGLKLVTIGCLLALDILALVGSYSLVESTALVILVIINIWALNCAR
jgi:hypothetical protein